MASHRSLCGCLRSAPEPRTSEYATYSAWRYAHDAWQASWGKALREHGTEMCLKRQRDEVMAQRQAKQPQPQVHSIADLYE